MPVGTVRGRFELDTPALQALQNLEKQGVKTEAQFKALAKQIDEVADKKDETRIKAYGKVISDLGKTDERVTKEMGAHWVELTRIMKREVSSQIKELDRLEVKLLELDHMHATPSVDVTGITAARAEVAAFKAELNSLSRQTATPNVRSSTSPLARATPIGGGGGGAGFQQFGPGGGGGRAGGRVIDFGMRGIRPRSALIGVGAAYAQPLLGGATALLGSAGSAALGAGALAGTGYGTALVGGGLTYATAKPMAAELKNVAKAQQQLNMQIALHGANSTQAATAQAKLNLVMKQAPEGTKAFFDQMHSFTKEWKRVSMPGQANLLQAGAGFMSGLRPGLPSFGRSSTVVTGAIQRDATRFGQFLGGSVGQRGVSTGAAIFNENLPHVRRDLEAIVTMWFNLMRASRPFFREANASVDQFLTHSAKSSNNIGNMRGHIRTMVADFKTWVELLKAAGRLVRDLASGGRASGSNLVKSLTDTLNKWDAWIKSNPTKVKTFFQDSVAQVKALAGAVWEIAKAAAHLSNLLQPLLMRFSQLVSLAGGAGLLLPTALRFGAGRLFSRGGGGPGGTAGQGGQTTPPIIAAGGRLAATRAEGQALAGARIYGAGFRYGAPVSQLGRGGFVGGAQRAAGAVGRGAMSAGRFAAPILALNAVLAAAGTPGGGAGATIQNAISGASLGILPAAYTSPGGKDAFNNAIRFLTTGRQNQASPSLIGTLLSRSTGGSPNALGVPFRPLSLDPKTGPQARAALPFLRRAESALSRSAAAHPDDAQLAGELAAVKQLAVAYKQFADAKRAAYNASQDQKAARNILDLGKAFDILNKHLGRRQAIKGWQDDFSRMFSKLGPEGKRKLAQGGAAWVEEMRKSGQLSAKQVKEMDAQIAAHLQSIVGSFKDTGRRIIAINGEIFDGTRKQWNSIRDAMSTASEQALERVTKNFTTIQTRATNALRSMGFSGAQAHALVQGMDPTSNAATRKIAGRATAVGPGGVAGNRQNSPTGRQVGQQLVRARGGRILSAKNAYDMTDNIQMGDYQVGHGELVVNQHTEKRVDRLLGRQNTTLAREVQFEGRPHSRPKVIRDYQGIMPDTDDPMAFALGGRFATGGRRKRGALLSGLRGVVSSARGVAATPLSGGAGGMGNIDAMIAQANAIDSRHFPYVWGGGHNAAFSGPYDCSGAVSSVLHAGGALSSPLTSGGFMSWGNPGTGDVTLYTNQGHVYMSMLGKFFGTSHANPGGGAGWFPGGPRPGFVRRTIPVSGAGTGINQGGTGNAGPAQSINLTAPRSGLGGVPGALADRASAIYAAGLQRKINKRLGTMGGAGAAGGGGIPGGSGPWLQVLRSIAQSKGWSASDWEWIVQHESAGNPNARNPSSGAYGLGQFLGGTLRQYSRFGANSPDGAKQIEAMAHYIQDRYHNPTSAKAFWQAHNWYEMGGRPGSGGRFARDKSTFAGFMRHGASFETMPGRAAHFIAGEGNVKEEVHVRPIRQPRIPALKGLAGTLAGGVHVHFHGAVNASSQAEVDKLVTKVGDEVGKKLLKYLSDDVTADQELINA